MNHESLANTPQTIYAGKGGGHMSDGSFVENTIQVTQTNTRYQRPQEKAAEKGTAPEAKKKVILVVTPSDIPPAPEEHKTAAPLAVAEKPQPASKYFEPLPENKAIQQAAHAFQEKAEGKDLSEVSVEELKQAYNELVTIAKAEGENPKFLRKILFALADKGEFVEKPVQSIQAMRREFAVPPGTTEPSPVGKAALSINPDTYTDVHLKDIIALIQAQVHIRGLVGESTLENIHTRLIDDILNNRVNKDEAQQLVSEVESILEVGKAVKTQERQTTQTAAETADAAVPSRGADIPIKPETFKLPITQAIAHDLIQLQNIIKAGGYNPEVDSQLSQKIRDLMKNAPAFEDAREWECLVREKEQLENLLREVVAESRRNLRVQQEYGSQQQKELKEFKNRVDASLSKGKTEDILGALDEVVKGINVNDRYFETRLDAIRQVFEARENNNENLWHYYEEALEHLVERFLSQADENPESAYPQFNFTAQQNLDAVLEAARHYSETNKGQVNIARKGPETGERTTYWYLTNLKGKRYVMHELFRTMKDEKQYTGIINQLLRRGGLEFVENQIIGVSQMQIAYEKILSSLAGMTSETLLPTHMTKADLEAQRYSRYLTGRIQEEDKKLGIQVQQDEDEALLMKEYKVYIGDNEKGVPQYETKKRKLREWEQRRVYFVGRSLNAGVMRRSSFTVMGDLPKNSDVLYMAPEFEMVSRILAPFKLFSARFFQWHIAQAYVRRFIEFNKEKAKRDGLHYAVKIKDGKEVGLYGNNSDAIVMLDVGSVDLKSTGYRSRNIYLNNPDFKIIDFQHGEHKQKLTLFQYFDHAKHQAHEKVLEDTVAQLKREGAAKHKNLSDHELEKLAEQRIEHNPKEKHHFEGEVKKEMYKLIKPYMEKQRLFLGVLLRIDIGQENKEILWKTIVEMLPSKTAAFIPDETREIVKENFQIRTQEDVKAKKEVIHNEYGVTLDEHLDVDTNINKIWDVVKQKLWLIEHDRVLKDTELLRKKSDGDVSTDPTSKLEDHFGVVNLSETEKKIIKNLQELGLGEGKWKPNEKGQPPPYYQVFSKLVHPFIAEFEDAPYAKWNRIGDEDIDRGIGDALDLKNAIFEAGEVVANPAAKPEDVTKKLIQVGHAMRGPVGLGTAQKLIEPFISAQLAMTQMKEVAKWFGGIMVWLRQPRSESEEYNLQAHVAHDEETVRNQLRVYAQNEILADNPHELEHGKTQFQRLLERHKATWKHMFYMLFRYWAMILGPLGAYNLMKMIMPGDLVKNFGLK